MGIYDSFDNKSDPNHALWAVMTAGNTLADKQNSLIKESYQPIVDWDKARAKSTTQAYLDYLSGLTDKQLSDEFMKGETDLLDSTRSAAMQGGIRLDLNDENWKAIQKQRDRAKNFAQGEFDTEFNKNLTREQAEQAWRNNSQKALAEQAAKAYNGRVNIGNAAQAVDNMFDTVRKEELLNRMSKGASLEDIYNDNRFVRKGHETEDRLYNYDMVNSARLEANKEKLAADITAKGIDPNDTNAVIGYIRSHRDEYGINPDRLTTQMSTWFAPAGATIKDNRESQYTQAADNNIANYEKSLNWDNVSNEDVSRIFEDTSINKGTKATQFKEKVLSKYIETNQDNPALKRFKDLRDRGFLNSEYAVEDPSRIQIMIDDITRGFGNNEVAKSIGNQLISQYNSVATRKYAEQAANLKDNLANAFRKANSGQAFKINENDIKEGKIIPGVLNSSSVDGDRLVNTVFTGIPELNSSTREAKYSALNLLIQYKNSGITETKLNEALNAAAEKGDYDDLREIENTLKNVLNGPNAKAFKDQLSALGKYYSMLDSFNQNKKSQTMMGYNN